MGAIKLCLRICVVLLLACVWAPRASALDLKEWRAPLKGELWQFVRQFDNPPVVVISAEGVLWPADIVQRFMTYIDQRPAILKHIADSRQPPEGTTLADVYRQKCHASADKCLKWPADLFEGINERVAFQWARGFWEHTAKKPYLNSMAKIIQTFLAQKFDVWVISTAPKWLAEIGALTYKIGPAKVISTHPVIHENRITTRLMYRAPRGIVKSFLVDQIIRAKPMVVFGHSWHDYEILAQGQFLSVIINPPMDQIDPNNMPFLAVARSLGWHAQDFQDEAQY